MHFQRLNRLMIIAVSSLTLTATGCPDKQDAVSQNLIDAFASGCNSNGFWTQSALGQTDSLITVLESSKLNRDACAPFKTTLANVQALQGQLKYLTENASYKTYRSADEKLIQLDLVINAIKRNDDGTLVNPAYQGLLDAYKSAWIEATVERALYKNESSLNATAQMAMVMQSLTQQAGDLSLCLNQSPGAAVQLAVNAMAIGGGFISPVLGLGVASVGQLFTGAIEYIRHRGTNDAIWDLYSAKMPMALTCGLEAMTRLYCQANDAAELVKFQKKGYPKRNGPPSELWRGMDILNHRLPILQKWILKVKNGVRSVNKNESQQRTKAWGEVYKLDTVNEEFLGSLNETRDLYSASGDATTKAKTLSRFIVENATKLASTSVVTFGDGSAIDVGAGPFSLFKSDADVWACWIVYGLNATEQECPKFSPQADTLQKYVDEKLLIGANINNFETNWGELLTAVTNTTNVSFSQKITLSPQAALDSAFYPKHNNPRQALGLIKTFLEALEAKTYEANPHRKPNITKLLLTVNEAIAILDKENTPDNPPNKRLDELFKVFDLKKSARAFTEDLSSLIGADIDARMESGEMPQDTSDILRTASMDIRDRLRSTGATQDDVLEDLNEARGLSEKNIEIFRRHFNKSFARSVVALYAAAQKNGELERKGADRPNAQRLAKLCTLLVATSSQFPDQRSWEMCSKMVFYSIHADTSNANDPLALHVSDLRDRYKNKDFRQRVCAYHNFKRAEKLAEILKAQEIKRQ